MASSPRRGKAPLPPVLKVGSELARTAERTAELAVASARTIGFRTAMMAQAAGDPIAMSDPEFMLMGSEKVEASYAAALALADSLRPLYEAWMTWSSHQLHGNVRFASEIVSCRNPADLTRVYSHWINESLTGTQLAAGKMAEAISKMSGAALAPIHAAASANARRLAKLKR